MTAMLDRNTWYRLPHETRWRLFELSAVVVTGLGQLLLAAWLGLHMPFIVAVCLLWLLYVLLRARRNPAVQSRWGFSRSGVAESIRLSAGPFVGGAAFCVLFGLLAGTADLNLHIVPVLALYPLWGLVQQFLIVALLAGNLVAIGRGRIPNAAAIVIAAVLFAAVHAPNLPLVAATFVMGMITTFVYLKSGNIWFAGPFHGWIASLFYYFVLGDDPWLRLVELLVAS